MTLFNVQPSDNGNYLAVVTNIVGVSTSQIASLTVHVPASIKTPPASQTVFLGETAIFKTEAEGEAPLTFQWFKTNSPILAATNATLILTNAQLADASRYKVAVSNVFAGIVSGEATLTVNIPVTITAQPTSQSVLLGSNVTFSVGATGFGNLNYLWLKDGKAVPGGIGPDLRFRAQEADAGNYLARVFGQFGSATSLVASLTVLVPAIIRTQPQSQIAFAGNLIRMTPEVIGTPPLGYRWFKNDQILTNATNSVLEFASVKYADRGDYRFIVTNTFGAATSLVARLTVDAPPSITLQPIGLITLTGARASFIIEADGSPPLSYQWFKNNQPIAAETNRILVLNELKLSDKGDYRVVVRNAFGLAESADAILTVGTPVSIFLLPGNQISRIGDTVIFSAMGQSTAPLNYQWYKNGAIIRGATNTTLVLNSVKAVDGGNYAVAAANEFGNARSADAILSVRTPLAIKGDFNGDGFADLVFQDQSGSLASWFMTNSSAISADLLSPATIGEAGWKIVGSGDFDQDGLDDLLLQNENGALAVWFMSSRRLRAGAFLNTDFVGERNYRVVGTGDFNPLLSGY